MSIFNTGFLKNISDWTQGRVPVKSQVESLNRSNLYKKETTVWGQRIWNNAIEDKTDDYAWTGYLPVEPDTKYERSEHPALAAHYDLSAIHYFDKNKNHIGVITPLDATKFKTPLNCRYIGMNVVFTPDSGGWDLRDSLFIVEPNKNRSEDVLSDLHEKYSIESFDGQLKYKPILKERLNATTSRIEKNQSISNGWTGYIPVSPDTKYIRSSLISGNYNEFFRVHYYGENKERLGFINNNADLEFTTPSGCYYIGMNVLYGGVDYRPVKFYELDKAPEIPPIGKEIKSNDRLRYSHLNMTLNRTLIAVYENHVLTLSSDSKTVQYFEEGIIDRFGRVVRGGGVTDSIFIPNITGHTGGIVRAAVIFRGENGLRTLIFTSENQIFTSTNGIFGGWEIANVWAPKGEEFRHPSIDLTDKDPTGERYRLHLPSDIAQRDAQFYWFGSNQHLRWEGAEGFCFANYQVPSTLAESVNDCLFFTRDGKNIYTQYMFGFRSARYKLGGTTNYASQAYYFGDGVNTAGFTNVYPGGLTLKRRVPIMPSQADLEPVNKFEFGTSKTITGFTRGNPAVATLDNITDISLGECVLIEGDATDTEWNELRNLTADVNSGGNGRFYIVTAINGNDVTLRDALGNPNNNLNCRHIHSVSKGANGIIIGAGEHHPNGWLIFQRTNKDPNNSEWDEITRLNSSELGLQRTIGVHIRKDNKLLFSSDTGERQFEIQGLTVRGNNLTASAQGVWVGELADIDDWGKYKNTLWGITTAFFMRDLNGVILLGTERGYLYASFDEGDSWEFIAQDIDDVKGTNKARLIGFDKKENRFYFRHTDPNEPVAVFEIK